jgi:hypothetical protein
MIIIGMRGCPLMDRPWMPKRPLCGPLALSGCLRRRLVERSPAGRPWRRRWGHGDVLLVTRGSIRSPEARGVRFERRPKLTQHRIAGAKARRAAGEALAEIGRSYNVSHSTILRL